MCEKFYSSINRQDVYQLPIMYTYISQEYVYKSARKLSFWINRGTLSIWNKYLTFPQLLYSCLNILPIFIWDCLVSSFPFFLFSEFFSYYIVGQISKMWRPQVWLFLVYIPDSVLTSPSPLQGGSLYQISLFSLTFINNKD